MIVDIEKFHPGKLRKKRPRSSRQMVIKSQMKDKQEYNYPVRLTWERRPYMEPWNEICAWTIEHLGLPGIRYRTEITSEDMTWHFATQEDQLIFTLAWGNDGI